ncbi:MAG: SprT family zinc-dependent metalloprotease [Bacteroidetes bacterium]|nr:SprT family zinc-dependent metalloprotease [Bacteroidota bacterium]
MARTESPLNALEIYLPEGSFPLVEPLLVTHRVHLTITRSRVSILGDYRHALGVRNHRISVNGNLNRFAFLITLLHECAHLLTFIQHGSQVASHGKEWKSHYAAILHVFMLQGIFPENIRRALEDSLKNPAASSCADAELMRVLRQYDAVRDGYCLVDEIPAGGQFRINGGRVFKKGNRQRKRYLCEELATGRVYAFSPIYEVFRLP